MPEYKVNDQVFVLRTRRRNEDPDRYRVIVSPIFIVSEVKEGIPTKLMHWKRQKLGYIFHTYLYSPGLYAMCKGF